MNLYLISQKTNQDYDTFDSAVVAAPTAEVAAQMDPAEDTLSGYIDWDNPELRVDHWCDNLSDVKVRLIGKAVEGTKQGVICASFNAG